MSKDIFDPSDYLGKLIDPSFLEEQKKYVVKCLNFGGRKEYEPKRIEKFNKYMWISSLNEFTQIIDYMYQQKLNIIHLTRRKYDFKGRMLFRQEAGLPFPKKLADNINRYEGFIECTFCGVFKSRDHYYSAKSKVRGIHESCKPCKDGHDIKHQRSFKGCIQKMWEIQTKAIKENSTKRRKYTQKQFSDWCRSDPDYIRTYKEWVESNFDHNLKPSTERKNDFGHYEFSNICIVTKEENLFRCNHDPKRGLNKKLRAVIQYDSYENEIARYGSVQMASDQTGIPRTSISGNIHGKLKHAGGYYWKKDPEGKNYSDLKK